ncbi:MAG TPA: 1-acyl-sn-glycerol-3-phosphate acyltransferase [Paludibacter sp.]
MSKKKDYPLIIRLLKKYVIFTFKHFYGEYIVVGRENIPSDCPIIFAPNHLNALMDALAVHSISPKSLPVTFLARSDIFKNKLAASFLHSIKMLPAFRMRDGMENLGKNNEIFERCVDILHQNKALGIMPEGNQGEQRKLRMFTKGIFRIAFAAQQKYGSQPSVKIVPVGIDLGDFVKFGKHMIIIIGKPIEVSEYMSSYSENSVTATNEIRDRLRFELSSITLDLATETHYDCFETATEVVNTAIVGNLNLPNETIFRFVARQKIAKKLVEFEKDEPQKIAELESLCTGYTDCIKKINLHTWVLEQAPYKTFTLLLNGLFLIGTLYVFIYGFVLNLLPSFLLVFLRKQVLKVQFWGFFSSIHYGFGIFIFPISYLLQTVIFACLVPVPWWILVLFFISQYFFGKWAFQWYSETKKFMAKIRYRNLESKKSPILEQAKNLRKQIIQLIKL